MQLSCHIQIGEGVGAERLLSLSLSLSRPLSGSGARYRLSPHPTRLIPTRWMHGDAFDYRGPASPRDKSDIPKGAHTLDFQNRKGEEMLPTPHAAMSRPANNAGTCLTTGEGIHLSPRTVGVRRPPSKRGHACLCHSLSLWRDIIGGEHPNACVNACVDGHANRQLGRG